MKTQDRKEIRQIFNEGIQQLVLPILDGIYKTMATKKDVGEIVNKKITDSDTKIMKEMGLFRLEMNQRFDKTDERIDTVHSDLINKIDEVKKMENEDIQMLSKDIVKIKKKIAFSD